MSPDTRKIVEWLVLAACGVAIGILVMMLMKR